MATGDSTTAESTQSEARLALNKRRVMALFAMFSGGIFLVLSLILAAAGLGIVGVVIALIVALATTFLAWSRADSTVLDLSDVELADESRDPRLFNVTDGLCAAIGVGIPRLYVADEPSLNAMVAGRDAKSSSIVVTRGLLDELSLVELEAVVSLLLYRVKSGDVATETVAVTTVGSFGALSERFSNVDWLSRALSLPLPLVERAYRWIHPARYELDVDIAATMFTRYPPALASALEKMQGRTIVAAACSVTTHLWIAPPLPVSSRHDFSGIHAEISDRISVLHEL